MDRQDKIEWLLFHDYIETEEQVADLADEQLNKKYKDCQETEAERQYDLWVESHMCE